MTYYSKYQPKAAEIFEITAGSSGGVLADSVWLKGAEKKLEELMVQGKWEAGFMLRQYRFTGLTIYLLIFPVWPYWCASTYLH